MKQYLILISLLLALLSDFFSLNGPEPSLQAQSMGLGSDHLSKIEREIVKQINLARMEPHTFIKEIEKLRPHYKGKILEIPGEYSVQTIEGAAALNEAILHLKKSRRTFILTVSKGLEKSARDHVQDQVNNPNMSHDGTDGSTPFTRISRYGKIKGDYGENIGYGALTARGMVALFILSDGQPDRILRKNLFNRKYKKMGIACGEHKHYKYYCVVDFASRYAEKLM
ncbi:MAG: CAP domain-containing protein [Spirochaetia bacterium]|nr:CAP domain-containing protein [Spirochaetia bacterium]